MAKNKIRRRSFLEIGILGAAGIGTMGIQTCPWNVMGDKEYYHPDAPDKWVTSICGMCPGGCGIKVRIVGKRAVKIEGNPDHPVNRGGLCPNGHAGLQALYDPDRFKSALMRTGNSSDPKWAPIDWNQAVNGLAERLKKLRSSRQQGSVVLISGRRGGLTAELWRRFMNAYGSPNIIHIDQFSDTGGNPANKWMAGWDMGMVPDLRNVNFLLSLDSNIFEHYDRPVEISMAFGAMRSKKGPRSRFVHVGPHPSNMAIQSDRWLPILPGTEGALALGLAHMIVKERLYDRNFVAENCIRFEDWTDEKGYLHDGFRAMVLKNYSPRRVAKLTGLKEEDIIGLAREFAENRPALAVGSNLLGPQSQTTMDGMAIMALNALVGGIDSSGGMLAGRMPPKLALKEVNSDLADGTAGLLDASRSKYPLGTESLDGLAERLKASFPYRVDTVMLYEADPVFSMPGGKELQESLNTVPNVVSFSAFPNETTSCAHIVLPSGTFLEEWNIDSRTTINGYPLVGLAQKVIDPLYDTRPTQEVIFQIAARIGEPLKGLFPWKNTEDCAKEAIKSVFDAGHGDVFGPAYEEAWTQLLEHSGWRSPSYNSFSEFWKLCRERGGWWDPIYTYGEALRGLKTPSRRIEFAPEELLKNDEYRREKAALGDMAFMPHYVEREKEGSKSDHPLELCLFALPTLLRSPTANLPWLQDFAGVRMEEWWSTWVELNPDTALQYGIKDRSKVKVTTQNGAILCTARVNPAAMPGWLTSLMEWVTAMVEDGAKI